MNEEIPILIREEVFKNLLSGEPIEFHTRTDKGRLTIKVQVDCGDWKRKAELFKDAVLDDILPVWGSKGAVEIYEVVKQHMRNKNEDREGNT